MDTEDKEFEKTVILGYRETVISEVYNSEHKWAGVAFYELSDEAVIVDGRITNLEDLECKFRVLADSIEGIDLLMEVLIMARNRIKDMNKTEYSH